tara:strand:- start:9927 stop:10466 length:540 start_codon:yes stop_codon:yes gene_type:complete
MKIALIFKSLYFRVSFLFIKFFLLKNNYKKICVYDIDNTLAHSWPYLNDKKKYPKYLPYFDKIKEDIHLQINSNSLVIFCSVRPIKLYMQTLKWLKRIDISTSFFQLIFASIPAQKIDFLKIFLELNIPITFYDDMSYNHENGTVLFYENEIAELRKMNIKFFDAKKLKEKQGSIKYLE